MNGREDGRTRRAVRTRRRIIEAVTALHEEVGPAATTISAVAERAGVQRLTVYRHFEDEAGLIAACSAHWSERHPLPDPSRWSGLDEPGDRFGIALEAVYGYYAAGRPMLERVLRDERIVAPLEDVMEPWWAWHREVVGGLSAGWGLTGGAQRSLRAAIGHAVRFWTWLSLSEEGLSVEESAGLMRGWIESVAVGQKGRPRRT